jgi:hypothetical protein
MKTRALVVSLGMLLSMAPALAQVSFGLSAPGLSIGINVPVYPQLVRVPGYPVYYAPGLGANYFFYDSMYWVFQGDRWYASSWYNGPWWLVSPDAVPVYILRVPVRYYRDPPRYFHGWHAAQPPRWGDHWGHDWERRHGGWNQWDRRFAPAPAPLPVYQRQFSGTRYPPPQRQPELQSRHYSYQPREAVIQQHQQAQAMNAPPPAGPRVQQGGPRLGPVEAGPRHVPPDAAHARPAPREQGHGNGRGKDPGKGDERGQDRKN